MKESTGLLLKLSEQREKVNTFAEDGAPEELDKLKSESIALEAAYRAALTAEEKGTERTTQGSETREYATLLAAASVGRIVHAVASGRQLDGAEADLLQFHDLPGNAIPMAMLAPDLEKPEKFAVATITGDEPASTDEVLGQIFPQAVSAWCGVVGGMVPSGTRQVPVLKTGATAQALAKAASVTESTASIVITTLTPKRISAAVRFAKEDQATFPFLEESLKSNLRDSLADQFDKVVLTRAAAPKGLLKFGTDPTKNGSSVTNISHALSAIFAGVQGKHASQASEVKLLLGAATYADLGRAIFDAGSGVLGGEKLNSISAGVRVSANVPAKESTGEDALVVKGTGRRNAVSTMWDSVELEVLRNPYTDADKGEVILTAVAMFDYAILDEAGFTRVRFK